MERAGFLTIIKAFFFNHWGGTVVVIGLAHMIIGGYLSSLTILPMIFGTETRGTVIEKRSVPVTRNTVSHRIVYQFDDGSGNTFRYEGPVEREFFNALREGDGITTTYLAALPSVHFIEGDMTPGIGSIITIAGAVITALGFFTFLMEMRKIRDNEKENILTAGR